MLMLDLSRVARGIGTQKDFDHLAREKHRMPVLTFKLRHDGPSSLRRAAQKVVLEHLHGCSLCRRSIHQSDARSIATAIEHSLKSQAERTELPSLRLRVEHKIR